MNIAMTSSARQCLLALAVPLFVSSLALPPAAAQTAQDAPASGQASEARDTLQEAQQVVQQMKRDPELRQQMNRARGIFIAPNFARAAGGVGVQGGEGVLLARMNNGRWSNPVFYNMGGVSIGAQAGASAGAIAFLLMNDKALNTFKTSNNFSLNANAGLSIVDYSARAQSSIGKGDVIAWSDTEGLFAGASIGVSDIQWDEEESRAYYGTSAAQATPQTILAGQMRRSPPGAQALQRALAQQASGSGMAQTRTESTEGRMAGAGTGPGMRADRN